MRPQLFIPSLAPLLAAAALAQGTASPSPSSPGEEIRVEGGLVKYINQVNVPAEVEGKLLEMNVEEGMSVTEGDVLAVVDDTQVQLALSLKRAEEEEARLKAENDVNLRDARNAEKLAEAEAESYRDLYKKNAVPLYEMRKKQLEAVRATLRIELAENEMQIAQARYDAKRNEREMSQFEVERRSITAPFDGYIESRIAQLGEWVQPGVPIVTLVQLDRLRVEGVVNALSYGRQVTPGTPVRVRVMSETNADNAITVPGEIGFVSSEIDLNNRYRVWVDIENRRVDNDWAIKPGMKAEIVINPAGDGGFQSAQKD
jgi:multidrug efflux pump subunit AcrA (membrane-fusion protein)